jgi:hypothetical protein
MAGQKKFTPEKVGQIRNLVENGKSRQEIAELIGVTVGSLQVTCSKLGISLRQRGRRLGDPVAAADGSCSSDRRQSKMEPPRQSSQSGQRRTLELQHGPRGVQVSARPRQNSPLGCGTIARNEALTCRSPNAW